MVRLKGKRRADSRFTKAFTFHYGQIKSQTVNDSDWYGFPAFTFHYGQIKSQERMEPKRGWRYLHSTMVRLKGESSRFRNSIANSFTFHYGQIKRVRFCFAATKPKNLHSTMVRLKDDDRRNNQADSTIYIPLWSD